jgi:hypothetical protein
VELWGEETRGPAPGHRLAGRPEAGKPVLKSAIEALEERGATSC